MSSSADEVDATVAREYPSRAGYGAATVGGAVGGVIGAGVAFLLALPLRPSGEDQAWAELGWAIFTLIACAAIGIVGGAIGILRALRRQDAPDAGLTALVFVPTAALLVVGGPLVFAAPAVARWMSLGLRQWWDVRRAPGGAPLPARAAGRIQRVVLWVVLTFLGMSFSASQFNAALGGDVGGTVKVWVLCAIVPVLLLPLIWRAVPLLGVAALLGGALLVGAGMARTVTAELHPSPERLAQIARELDPPAGQRVVSRTSALAVRFRAHGAVAGSDAQPVEIIQSVPLAKATSPLPPALRPDAQGFLAHEAPSNVATAPTEAGLASAADWQRALLADGWSTEALSSEQAPGRMDWLPSPASDFLAQHGRPLLGRGLWLRAVVVPFGDGAIVVLSTRP